MEPDTKNPNIKKVIITSLLVFLTAGVVGGGVYYALSSNFQKERDAAAKDKQVNEKAIKDLEKEIAKLKSSGLKGPDNKASTSDGVSNVVANTSTVPTNTKPTQISSVEYKQNCSTETEKPCVQVVFAQAMDNSTIDSSSIYIVDSNGKTVTNGVFFEYSSSSWVARLNINRTLVGAGNYQVKFSNSIKDSSGKNLSNQFYYSFAII